MKLQENKDSFFVHIPIAIVRAKSWKKGQELRLIITPKGTIEMKEI